MERCNGALVESSVGTPGGNVRVELRPGLNRRQEVVDSCELRDVVSATGEKFVVLSNITAEVAEVGEEDKRGHDGGLSCVDFVFGAKHRCKFRCRNDA